MITEKNKNKQTNKKQTNKKQNKQKKIKQATVLSIIKDYWHIFQAHYVLGAYIIANTIFKNSRKSWRIPRT